MKIILDATLFYLFRDKMKMKKLKMKMKISILKIENIKKRDSIFCILLLFCFGCFRYCFCCCF